MIPRVAVGVLAGVMSLNAALAQDELPFLHPLFTDHMVLQRGMEVPVWGWTEPGQDVTVRVDDRNAKATADATGKWMVKIGPLAVGAARTMSVTGPQQVILQDVLVGDVWLCSGQSNMEMGLTGVINALEELTKANHPQLRLFTVPKAIAAVPRQTLSAQWDVCTPETAGKNGGFSAVAYCFGRDLQKEINVPIGLIHTSWGGTFAEAWTSAEALSRMSDFNAAIEAVQTSPPIDLVTAIAEWWQKNDPGSVTAGGWSDPRADMSEWKTMAMPNLWEQAGLPDFDGIVWFGRDFDLPSEWEARDLFLHLGTIDDRDTTFVNGVKVGEANEWNAERHYAVSHAMLKPGRNTIRVRVLDTGGGGGFGGTPEGMRIEAAGMPALVPLSLAGEWLYRVSTPTTQLPAVPQSIANNPNIVTVLYNGMIAPLVPFGVKGAIWYQGESNVGRARQYQTLLPTMITDWRKRFQSGDFPFLIVELANYLQPKAEPGEDLWAELREAQMITAQKVPNVGIASAIDIGDAVDIHPKNKQEVGRRLSLAARAIAYGETLVSSGPLYRSMAMEGHTIRLRFDHVGGGLKAKNDAPLRGFSIAGEDEKFVWAEARIDGDTVVVSSAQVEKPQAVRYAWESNPTASLYNAEGLPASPFRTDRPIWADAEFPRHWK